MKTLLIYVMAAFMSTTTNPTTEPVKNSGTKEPVSQEFTITSDVTIKTEFGEITLRSGTPVVVESTQSYNSKNLNEGQTVNVRVKYNVVVNKKTVIAAGALGNATITDIQRPGIFGKPGRLEMQVQSVQSVDGQQILLSGMNMISEGQNKRGLAWGLGIGLGLFTLGIGLALGFFIKGKSAEVKAGTTSNASVASDAQVEIEEK
jgi:hypothetical protein